MTSPHHTTLTSKRSAAKHLASLNIMVNSPPKPQGQLIKQPDDAYNNSASQDSQVIPSSQPSADVNKPPVAHEERLTPVTFKFVSGLVMAVERNYLELASLEAQISDFKDILNNKIPIPPSLKSKRSIPALKGDYQFSVVAQVEINNIETATDRRVITRLRDDLITNVIPMCQDDCRDIEKKVRRRLVAECPPSELDLAKKILEREIKRKSDNRQKILTAKSQHQSSRKRKHQDSATQGRRPPPLMSTYPGPSLQSSRQQFKPRRH